ncbi:MAG: alpha/beta hydrolase [Clostridia bacterium]|nr:alpha/beta hydrolase [Clostridia bacterium]
MGKSFMAGVASFYFRMLPKYTDVQWKDRIEKLKTKAEKSPRAPKGILYRLVQTSSGSVFWLNESNHSEVTILYLHGGAYVHDFSRFHWLFLKKIAKQTDAEIIAPAYHLVPYGTYQEAFELIVPLYQEYRKMYPNRKMVLMGDSAGGGLALALSEYFNKEKISAPDELILLSPWVDVSMNNPSISAYEGRDPWITPSYRVAGQYWAGDTKISDWRISPIHGELHALKNVTVFYGTEEILWPDMLLLKKQLEGESSNEFIEGEGMNHVYPILPIPEAKAAIDKICRTITESEASHD